MNLQPISTGQLLDRTFTLYRKHFFLFAGIAAVPPFCSLVWRASIQMVAAALGPASVVAILVLSVAGFLVYLASLAMGQAATARAVSHAYLERPVSIGSAYKETLPHFWRYTGVTLGVSLLTVLGFIALIIPGIYIVITYSLAIVASANEGLGFSAATKRSKQLVKGNRNRIAAIFLISVVITYALVFGLMIPVGLLAQATKNSPVLATLLSDVAGFIAGTLAGPIALIGFTLAYYDARVRKEAFDLQLMMENSPAPQTAAAAITQ